MPGTLMDSPELDTLSRSLARTVALLSGTAPVVVPRPDAAVLSALPAPEPESLVPDATPASQDADTSQDADPGQDADTSDAASDRELVTAAPPQATTPSPEVAGDPLVEQMLAGFDPARYVGSGAPSRGAAPSFGSALPDSEPLDEPDTAPIVEPAGPAGSVLNSPVPEPHAGPRDKREVMHMLRELSELRG